MRLYFLRHAHAVDGADDEARVLSDKGEAQCQQLGEFCRQAGTNFDAAYVSPLIRAVQTADLVLKRTNSDCPISLKEVEALRNETSSDDFFHWLDSLPKERHVLLVGHAPSLADRLREMLGIGEEEHLVLPKGGLACVKMFARRKGALKWLVNPKVL